ncbi:MAG TPA: TIGR04255 family protein [Melioribacteraceae bacterium]|nr:TIGR04255 family protein [Melioribacteraceae bacterium]
MELPKRLVKCPIIEALIELRFNAKPNIHNSLLIAELNLSLKKFSSQITELPILEIPNSIRLNDPNLKYKPFYKLGCNGYIIQFGPDVISINCVPQYLGWEKFSSIVSDVVKQIKGINLINSFDRLGVRYINFIEGDILDHTNISVNFANRSINNLHIRTEVKENVLTGVVQVLQNANYENKQGTVIDIDVIFTNNETAFDFSKIYQNIEDAHLFEKELFFSLLKNELIEQLGAEY